MWKSRSTAPGIAPRWRERGILHPRSEESMTANRLAWPSAGRPFLDRGVKKKSSRVPREVFSSLHRIAGRAFQCGTQDQKRRHG